MEIFNNKDKMSVEQQAISRRLNGLSRIAQHFEQMVESELELCMENYRTATNAVNLNYEGLSDDEMRTLDSTNHEMDVIAKYWFLRATSLIEFVDRKSYPLAQKLREQYLK